MAVRHRDQPLYTSLIDRLLDDRPHVVRPHAQEVADLRKVVRREIEALLNTRRRCLSPPSGLDELETSLVNYGIPDFTGLGLGSEARREQFRAAIEEVLRRYEPRFQQVSVLLLDNSDALDRTIRFRIDALLSAHPDPEPLVFDSELEPTTNTFNVRERAE